MGLTDMERLKERLAAYYECERAILTGQSYRLGDRELHRADLAEVRKAIKDMEERLATLEGRLRRIKAVEL